MSGERQEHGPDFMYSVSREDTAVLRLVGILVQKGYAVSLADQDRRFLTLNASPNAREMIDRVVMSPEFIATQGALRGIKRGGVLGNMWEIVQQCDWPEATKQRVLDTYLLNREMTRVSGEVRALKTSRSFHQKVDDCDITALLSPSITKAETKMTAEGTVRE